MPRILACPVCKSRMRVPDDSGGLKTRCPKCSRALRVPLKRRVKPEPAANPVLASAGPSEDELVLTSFQIDLGESVVWGTG